MNKNIFLLIFCLIGLGDLIGNLPGMEYLEFYFKPLIMISLLGYFIMNTLKPFRLLHRLMVLAIIFSWGGDVLLMFNDLNPVFFMLGLLSFLVAHLFFISAYLNSIKGKKGKSILLQKPYLLIPFIVFFAGLYGFMYPNLKELTIPVFVYATILVSMSVFALNRSGKVPPISFSYVMIGAVLFVISDACIAINKFAMPFAYSGLLIMLTYIAAQYLIVEGMMRDINQ